MSQQIKRSELQIGDRVRHSDALVNPFSDCVVSRIKNGHATLFRPYVHTADFTCTSGVICYTRSFCSARTCSLAFWTIR